MSRKKRKPQLFQKSFLAQEEKIHARTFRGIAEKDEGLAEPREYSIDIRAKFTDSLSRMTRFIDELKDRALEADTLTGSLAIAEEIERTSIEVYSDMRKKHTETFARVLDLLIKEEKKHLRMILNVAEKTE